MDFLILGSLEVHDGDRLFALRGRRQRALLAMLVLHANEVVPDERLLEELWGGEAPKSGRAAVRVRISELRKALGDDVVLTRPPGYLLRAEADRIDASRFERLLAEGKSALAEGKTEPAADLLREGLSLWRGPALADFAYERFAQAEIARLEELRLTALEERVEADLALGRHAELVGELEALVSAEPLRERPRGQLMLALYRSERQAEALAAYREGRTLLVDELGLEPSPALQELEGAILRHEPSLEPPAPTSTVRRAPARMERKIVTVLAAELAESPKLRDPERRAYFVDRLHESMAREIEQAGGRLESAPGCPLTAAFGVPVAQEDHPERALHTALAMRRRFEDLFRNELTLRLGVDTGEVVVGRAGKEGSSVEGAAVATSVRLAQAAGPGAILVGARTTATVRGAFEFGAPIDVGGASGRPLVRALTLTRTHGVGRRFRSRFVGRESELDQLRAVYRRAVDSGRPHLLTVTGDAGVGKSRLVEELWERLAAETPEPQRRTGRCLPYGRTPYRPLADVLREELGLLETDTPGTVRRRLGEREILGLTLGLDVAPDLHPLAARERLQAGWVELLTDLATERPTIVLVEDLHWAQEPLLDLLERLLEDVRGALLLVGTARPELLTERPSWGRRREAATLWLEPLSHAQAAEMLADAGIPEELRPLLLERAEGNPFFLEELLAGHLERALPSGTEVPDSVQAVLAARIDLLPPSEKAALQAAAVIGRVFWRGPVRELLEGDAPDFAVLEARDFIRRRSGSSLVGEREFAFKHALTRDVAYASLPAARRARLHAAFATWLERTGEGRDEHAAFLAHHYAEAVRPEDADLTWQRAPAERERLRDEAVGWLRRAAELALGRYELDDALALFSRALELEGTGPRRSALWRWIGRVNALRYDGEPFLAAMENAIAYSSGDDRARAALYAELAFETCWRSGMWKRRPEAERVEGWIAQAIELGEPGTRARAQALIARSLWDPETETEAAREGAAIADRLQDAKLRCAAWDALSAVAMAAGDYEGARAWTARRFELLPKISDADLRADIVHMPIIPCIATCRFEEARRLAREHDEVVQPLTPHHRVHGVAIVIEVEELLGGWETIRALEQRTEAAVAANAETPCTRNARSLLVCAVARMCLGDERHARELEESANRLGLEGGLSLDTPRLRLSLLRRDRPRCEELLSRFLDDEHWNSRRRRQSLVIQATWLDALATLGHRDLLEGEAPPLLGANTYLDPVARRALGVVRADQTLLHQALARFEALELPWHARETRALLAS